MLVTWEHNFRTVPLERIGWRWAVERGWGIVAFGGHGSTWMRDAARQRWLGDAVPDGWHHEVGVSLSGLFGLLRLDLARRIDAPGWAVGFGAARLF